MPRFKRKSDGRIVSVDEGMDSEKRLSEDEDWVRLRDKPGSSSDQPSDQPSLVDRLLGRK